MLQSKAGVMVPCEDVIERMTLHNDESFLNQLDCPLLHMTYLTETVPSVAIR